MASLKETKNRIASVKSTLKITSAMKMVASAKLHKAQNAIESMLPYEQELRSMLQLLLSSVGESARLPIGDRSSSTVAIVAFASNSSLCGGFNANAIREAKARIAEVEAAGETVEVFAVGRKAAESLAKAGYPTDGDYSGLLAHSSYEGAAAFAKRLQDGFADGKYARVELIYNHFVSTSTQKVVRQTYLPMELPAAEAGGVPVEDDIILEPSAQEMLSDLLPLVQSLGIWTVILDTTAAEHAARTVAMQTATDNGEDILRDLTLEYNKGRQQKITSEILDIVGGTMK